MTKYVLKSRKRWCALKSVFPDFEKTFQEVCVVLLWSGDEPESSEILITNGGTANPDAPAWILSFDRSDIIPAVPFNESSWNVYPATIPPDRGLMQLECWSFENQTDPLRCCGSYDESTDTWTDTLTGETIEAESIHFKPWG